MELNKFKNILESSLAKEIRKYIISEAENSGEKFHIMCDGEPIATFDNMDKAEEELPKYQKSHPDKELIIEKGVYESYEDMIEKLDEMGEELEEMESNDMEELEEKDQMCEQCGGEMNEGECMECGSKMVKESKKRKIRIKESEFVKLIANIVSESVPGLEITKRAQNQSKKDNEAYASEVKSKMEKASKFDGNDNPEFPKQIGKGEKVARVNTDDEDEIVADNRGGGLEDLDYATEPSEMFKDRAKKAIVGHKTMGNSQDAANVMKSDLGEKIVKKIERKKDKTKKDTRVSWGHAWKEPTDVNINESEGSSKKILNEEIQRMKNLTLYNKKTQ
jgi:hypothetical protein